MAWFLQNSCLRYRDTSTSSLPNGWTRPMRFRKQASADVSAVSDEYLCLFPSLAYIFYSVYHLYAPRKKLKP